MKMSSTRSAITTTTTQAWSSSVCASTTTTAAAIQQTQLNKFVRLKAANAFVIIKHNNKNNYSIPPFSSFGVANPSKPIFRPLMSWQHCTVKKEVDVPVSVAYQCYSDRQSISQWMPFISSVQVLQDKPDLSKWTLKYEAFGRDIHFSWLARNLQPIPNQKIHWTSLEGLPNSGAVRFYPKGASSCLIELTVSYEVPQILVPVASALQPFLQNLLMGGLERFSNFAKNYRPNSTT